jgi:hypothetical protein
MNKVHGCGQIGVDARLTLAARRALLGAGTIRGRSVRVIWAVVCALVGLGSSAEAATLARAGFVFPAGPVRIVLLRPEVRMGAFNAGGFETPNADWIAAARVNIQRAFVDAAEARAANLTYIDEAQGDDADVLGHYRSLFGAVADAVMEHGLTPDRLPTKRNGLDWSLGPGIGQVKALSGAGYALFVKTHDAYGTSGRKALQVLAALRAHAVIAPGIHAGYAALVDLRTGDLVWFTADLDMGGDLRQGDGARKRVGELLHGFPRRPAT